MPHILECTNEITAVHAVQQLILSKGFKSNRYLEINNLLLSVDNTEDGVDNLEALKNDFLKIVGESAKQAIERTHRVFDTLEDKITKPSYLKRLRAYEDILDDQIIEIDQLENIINELAKKPRYSLLSFVFLKPQDLIKKQRPGYVPCPIAGDFKFRNGELQLNVFFRSQDAMNFLFPDLIKLRELQNFVLQAAQEITKFEELKKGRIGKLTLHCSRSYIPLRMEPRKKVYINWNEIESKLSSFHRILENKL